MEPQEREEWTGRSNALRQELKVWEKEFATANEGRKASREDIKNVPDIAQKYKDYNKARDILAGKFEKRPVIHQETPRKRKREDQEVHDASKRQQLSATPSRSTPAKTLRPWDVDPYDSPATLRKLFSPTKKTTIGPTPQKDGQVLGLFDLLEDSPSKPLQVLEIQRRRGVQATPSKNKAATDGLLSQTPTSSRRTRKLDPFHTPSRGRLANPGDKTPSTISKLNFSTPSFLKRDSFRALPTVDENIEFRSPERVRGPRKPIVRGLSSILAGLRQLESEAADADLEMLREMEREENEPPRAKKPAPPSRATPSSAAAPTEPSDADLAALREMDAELEEMRQQLVTKPPTELNARTQASPAAHEDVILDSQVPHPLLGGFDDEAMYDSEPDATTRDGAAGLGPDGQPRRAYKKKGQKRTTRRSTMRPAHAPKPPSHPAAAPDSDSEPDTAPDPASADEAGPDPPDQDASYASDSQSEYTASEGGTRTRRPVQRARKPTTTTRLDPDGIRRVVRKVGSLAHQNFKRLKLRNSGAKGGPAHNSRFRRKR